MYNYFYNSVTDVSYTKIQVINLFGIDPDVTDIEVLNYMSLYPVVETQPTADPYLYNNIATYVVAGQYANQVWIASGKPIGIAQTGALYEINQAADAEINSILNAANVSIDALTAVAAQPESQRPPTLVSALNSVTNISNQLAAQRSAVGIATTVSELNDIVNDWLTPETVYSTADDNVYNGITYDIGDPLVLYSDNPIPAATGFTTVVPPGISTYPNFSLYWDSVGVAFTYAPWPVGTSTAVAIDYGQEWINNECNVVLESTNWIDTRVAAGVTYNSDWYDWRVGVQTTTAQKIEDLEALLTIEEVYDYVTNPAYTSIPFVPLSPPYKP